MSSPARRSARFCRASGPSSGCSAPEARPPSTRGATATVKRVAIKLLRPDRALDPGIRQRFLREGYAANAVGHPGVVSIDDDEEEAGAAFLVMELLEGESVDKLARRLGGRVPWEMTVELLVQLLEILEAGLRSGVPRRRDRASLVVHHRGRRRRRGHAALGHAGVQCRNGGRVSDGTSGANAARPRQGRVALHGRDPVVLRLAGAGPRAELGRGRRFRARTCDGSR